MVDYSEPVRSALAITPCRSGKTKRINDGMTLALIGMRENIRPVAIIIVSAALFGISAPLAKSLVEGMPATELAGLLYLGAFLGLGIFTLIRKLTKSRRKYEPIARKDIKWLAGSIVSGGVVAPILMVTGLTLLSGFTASLLLNLEGVFTALLAVTFFCQKEGKRLWAALLIMTLASVLLTYDPSKGGVPDRRYPVPRRRDVVLGPGQ